MKRIFLSIFVILAAAGLSISAQTSSQKAFEKGMKSAQSGKYETALTEFQSSLAFAKSDETKEFLAKIHFNVGVCFYKLKQNAEAVGEFEQAVELSGDYEKAFYALGMTQAELKDWQAAEKAFRGAIRLNKQNGEAWFDLAFVYLAQENYEAARNAFQKSVDYKSVASHIGHNNLGVILAISGDVPAAVGEFEKALKDSNGKFAVAERNLQFCKSLGQNLSGGLVAKLEFGK